MNRKVLEGIALGVGGLVVALVLTLGAFTLAGQDIGQPADVPMFTAPATPSPGHHRSPDPKASTSPAGDDDHGGGGTSSGPGGGSDDHAGSGSGSSEGPGSGSADADSDDGSSGSGSGDDSGGHEDD